jgi:hypothetical protein
MAAGFNRRDLGIQGVLNSIIDRLRRVEHPTSIHLGPIGGITGSPTQGYTISVNAAGQLVATSDLGTVTIIGLP